MASEKKWKGKDSRDHGYDNTSAMVEYSMKIRNDYMRDLSKAKKTLREMLLTYEIVLSRPEYTWLYQLFGELPAANEEDWAIWSQSVNKTDWIDVLSESDKKTYDTLISDLESKLVTCLDNEALSGLMCRRGYNGR